MGLERRGNMKKKIDNNNLIPWFMDDHQNLPADYLESCQRFFLELDRKQSEKAKTYTKRYIEWRKKREHENKRSNKYIESCRRIL